jgi:hypothetical protein
MLRRKESRVFGGVLGSVLLAGIAWLALLAPASAGAATVVNGDFETGNLNGWTVLTSGGEPEFEGWFAYSGTASPKTSQAISAPPQGLFAATSDESGPGTHILYQDVALEPFFTHTLTTTVYYRSQAPIAVPTPDTLSANIESENQQYRIDVMKPTAAIESLNPSDILATVFQTKVGDPETLAPTTVTANLTPFAGQTVRLRFAEVDNEFFFNASADAVSIASTPPSNAFTLGALALNRKKGTGTVPVTVPGAGILTAVDAHPTGVLTQTASASAKGKKKPYKALIKPVTLTATAAGTLVVNLKPSGPGRKILVHKGKLSLNVLFTYTPTGGTASSQTLPVTLKLKLHKKPNRHRHG